jgi:predicted DNA-binding WGR domain protein
MNRTTLINLNDNHRKFYTVEVIAHSVYLSWGRIGTKGQSKTEVFGSTWDASRFAADKVDAKLGRGYEFLKVAA